MDDDSASTFEEQAFLKWSRRSFLGCITLSLANLPFASWGGAPKDTRESFDKICRELNWDLKGEDSFIFVHATDLHSTETPGYDRGALSIPNKYAGPCFVDDINRLSQNAFTVLTGDLISNTTVDPACWPKAVEKWRYYQKWVVNKLQAPVYQILGNNDCAAAPYQAVFPDRPLWWSLKRQGILFIALHGYSCWKAENTNHAGILYDRKQLEWMKGLIDGSGERTLVLFTHEPLSGSDSHLVRRQLKPILKNFSGEEIWNICGHYHLNSDAYFKIGKKRIREVITMTPVGIGFTPGDGGYRIFFCKEGKICSSVLRWMTVRGEGIGFSSSPDWNKPDERKLNEDAFPKDALKVSFVGANPFELGSCSRIENRISNYYISRPGRNKSDYGRLCWSIPGQVGGKPAQRILFNTGKIEGHLDWSVDGKKWNRQKISWLSSTAKRELIFPHGMNAEKLWIRITNESVYESKFYGYALFSQEK